MRNRGVGLSQGVLKTLSMWVSKGETWVALDMAVSISEGK